MMFFSIYHKINIGNTKALCSKILLIQRSLTRDCNVRRALLYVPGNDERKLFKALNHIKVDCIIMDCEDGVALNQKEQARQTIKKILDEGPVTENGPEWIVRVNSVKDSRSCEEDINVLLACQHLPSCICLPKVDCTDQLQWFSERVWNALIKRPDSDGCFLKLLIIIESAIAIMNLPEICKKAVDLSTMAPLNPVGLLFGRDDLGTSLGVPRTSSGVEILYARQKLVLVAKAFGLQAIDMVNINYKDSTQFEVECDEGAKMGYTGKQVIHPDQVAIAQEMFVPSASRIEWAKRVIEHFEENQINGKGAFALENAVIDMPFYKEAKNIIEAAKASGKLQVSENTTPDTD